MWEFFADYGLFLIKSVTVLVVVVLIISLAARMRREDLPGLQSGHLEVEALNDRYEAEADALRTLVWDDAQWKLEKKARKQRLKDDKKRAKSKEPAPVKPKLFVLQFKGDIAASAVAHLRHEVSALLAVANKEQDEVLLLLESPGGMVHGYGLAASQLVRIREAGLKLTVCVDKVAASGGYLMAAIANRLLAAPFAVVGSIGVVAQIPNVHRLLKRHDVDVELMTAGEYKRTLTVLGENTEAGRQKFQEDLDDTHALFKEFVQQWRSSLDIDRVGTGEHWYGSRAIDLGLIDEIKTSDDYLRERAKTADLFALHWRTKSTLGQRLGLAATHSMDQLLLRWWQRSMQTPKF